MRFSRSIRRTDLALRVSCIALAGALAAVASPAAAQDTAASDQAADAANDIVVSGFRASLQSATAKKKNVDQVVESVTAEDIGKLPDASIAESIARLPGLTSQRLSGRSNSISIRGFSPDFSTTLLNGREQTSTGDNRAVEYDQYPSEVVNSVLVYKTPMASIIGQGLSGTVDLRTIRPLEYGKTVVSIGARGSYADLGKLNAKSRDLGYRVNGVYVGQFMNDTLGVALSASYVNEPYQISEFNSWGYANTTAAATPVVIGGSKSYNTSTTLKRLGLQGTVEWKPAPNFTTTFDAFYSDFKDDQIKRGIELPLYWGGAPLTNAQTDPSTGLITSGTFTGVKGVVRNDAFQRHAKLYSFGWNGAYKGDNGWNAYLDVSYSKTDRNELNIESYSGTGRAGVGATDTIGFSSGLQGSTFTHNLNYGDYNLIQLTSPQGWGGTQIATNGTQVVGGQDGYYNNRFIRDELWQYRAEVEKEIDNGFIRSVQFGLNYTNRSKALTPDEYFLGLKANTNGTTSVSIPSQYRLGMTNLLFGLGPVVSYDPVALVKSGIYNLVPNPYGDVVVKAYDIREKLMTGYFQTNIKHQMGASELTGNVGVQVIVTDQNSNGASAVYLGANPNGSPNIGVARRNASTDYVDVLPSLNLSLRLPSDFVIRFAAAREIIRPRLDDMRATVSFGYTFATINGQNFAQVTGSSGNPDLRPWRANAVDLTFEKYFGEKGFISAQFFYKDLKSYIYNQDTVIPTTSLALASPGPQYIISPTAVLNTPINGKGGSLYGAELAATLPFSTFTSALDGFGITGGASYTKTQIHPTPGAPSEDIPGYSKWVANGTLFFEKWGFNARGSVRYRSTFVGEVSGFAANRVRRRAAPETIVDAQVGYDFGGALKGLSIYVQGQNLTDEPFTTYNPNHPEQVIDYQKYGRRFLAGASFKF
ncbi:MAG: TonB-dependent receptor [Sphingomonas sp.]|uniref:TonB-dependent receptor n=1 Tax=Sphingomonas sp. TaxID=28214 RepID=UPI001AD01BAC|nr:TonB-dependent receptor [Sphingomonas sp.]MBN8815168.1 TonB-dependent receptor [Sphingomonas sp.]